ncbi:hypothetical protein K3495_g9015, partial [Podosphaera aphanis]
ASLQKAVVTCVLPTILYGAEAWFAGLTKPLKANRVAQNKAVSCRLGGHVSLLDKVISATIRGVLPVWRTTPIPALFRDSGLPSALVALEEAKIRFARRLQSVDAQHPFVRRISPPLTTRGRGVRRSAEARQEPKTKLQRLATLLPRIPRPLLVPPRFTPGCREDPTGGSTKEDAAKAFKEWWKNLPPEDITIFSDGSEQYVDGNKYVGFGFSAYSYGHQFTSGYGSINNISHVFDAEIIGALRGLQKVLLLPIGARRRIWMCIDSTLVIWGLRGNAALSSQWAFNACHAYMDTNDIQVKWSPGHTGIIGNEAADKLADMGALQGGMDAELAARPTFSGISSIAHELRGIARTEWWEKASKNLSAWYTNWQAPYLVRTLPELSLSRRVLHRLLAIRSSHGDFEWYHRKFKHENAKLVCSCGRAKTPDHSVRCRKSKKLFARWPLRPPLPPNSRVEGLSYLGTLLANPKSFNQFLELTEFYSKICTR